MNSTSFDLHIPFVDHLGIQLLEKADGRVRIRFEPRPEHLNSWKGVHGGVIMKLVDEAGGICATRHARRPTVTVAMDSMTFLSPVRVGDLVTFRASINWVGRT